MLEIKTNGNNLNLPKDITFNLVIENPFFLQDRIPSPHSLDFKLPGTPENKHRLGNPDRLASINSFGEYPAEVLFNTLKFASGKLVVDEFEKLIESHFRGSAFSEVVRQKLFAPEMEKYDFDFSSGMAALFTTPGNWAYAYRQLMIAATTAPDKFAVAPIRIKGAEWPYEESSWGNYATSTMYLSKYNVNNGSFYFPDGIGTHGTMFPMPFVSYLLEFLFGDALTANPFNTGELTNLVLPTVYHPAYNANYTVGAHQGVLLDGDKYFYLNSYLPDLASNEWLKDLLKTFCFTMFPNGNSFEIIHNKDIIEDNDVIDWDSKLVGDLTKTKEAGQSYGYGYSDNKAQTTGYTVNTIADLMGLALSEDAEYLIETTGQVIKKKLVAKENEEDPQEYEYEIVSPGFGGADGDYSMKPSLTPLSNKPDKYWWENCSAPKRMVVRSGMGWIPRCTRKQIIPEFLAWDETSSYRIRNLSVYVALQLRP